MSTAWPEPVARALIAAGWTPDRSVDTAASEAMLARWGIPMSARAQALIAELEGLECAAPHRPASRIEFDVDRALFWLGPDDAPFLGGLIDEPLVPFGADATGLLLIAPSGAVVALDGEWRNFVRYPSVGEAIESRLFPRAARYPITRIPDARRPPDYR